MCRLHRHFVVSDVSLWLTPLIRLVRAWNILPILVAGWASWSLHELQARDLARLGSCTQSRASTYTNHLQVTCDNEPAAVVLTCSEPLLIRKIRRHEMVEHQCRRPCTLRH